MSRSNLVRQGSTLALKAEEFLKLPLKDRLLFAKGFKDGGESLSDFLDEVMLVLKKQGDARKSLKNVYHLRTYTNDSSALPRLMLEHLALVL